MYRTSCLYDFAFDLALPMDDYDLGLVDPQTGEDIFMSTYVTLGAAPSCASVTKDNFHVALPPPGLFPLHARRNATDVSASYGVTVGEKDIRYFDRNDWFTYNNMSFGSAGETTRIRLRFAKGAYSGRMEVRLGDRNGQLIGTFVPWNTGDWSIYVEATFDTDESVEGLHMLTFVGVDSSGILNLNWFELAPPVDTSSFSLYSRTSAFDISGHYGVTVSDTSVSNFDAGNWFTYSNIWFGEAGDTGRLRIQFTKGNDWAGGVEVKLGDENGPIIGTFTPWFTGSWETAMEADIEIDDNIEGLHQLTFLGTSANSIINLLWFELAPPVDTSSFSLYTRKIAGVRDLYSRWRGRLLR